ncbi:hypothetical protein HHI36_003492 [Cryptolaemus montrouzieri]|uniref:Uncharacterized protein n=1 Tax=Cryptolaemus montrouzieri TaxID=559131 RepID=A0ABD2PDT5_9CUCU
MLDNRQEIHNCDEYKYLGCIFNRRTRDHPANHTSTKSDKLLELSLWSNTVSKDKKFTIYDTMLKSILLYGSATWRITDRNRKKVEATEMDEIRSMIISRRMGLTNEIVRRQLTWYGHVQRMDNYRVQKQVMMWTSVAKRKRGRPHLDGGYKKGHVRKRTY